jgi:hypothetical protein
LHSADKTPLVVNLTCAVIKKYIFILHPFKPKLTFAIAALHAPVTLYGEKPAYICKKQDKMLKCTKKSSYSVGKNIIKNL